MPPGEQRIGAVEGRGDDHEGDAHGRELRADRQGRVEELRKEGGIEEDGLGIGDRDQDALPEDAARRHGL